MWIKLGSEHLNLDHVVRIRFNAALKNGQEELVAELEAFVDGEIQVFCRYRGPQAEKLRSLLHSPSATGGESRAASPVLAQASTNTLHDLQLP
jgi:hypothetical protein